MPRNMNLFSQRKLVTSHSLSSF